MPTYRPLPDDRDETFEAFVRYAFHPQDGPLPDDHERDRPDLGERRGLFDGDELLSACRHYYLTARVRGAWTDVAGLSAVATPPEHRRRGYVRRMLAESLREYRDREANVSVLWPFEHSFYRRMGWGRVGRHATWECPPDALPSAPDRTDGRFRRLSGDDHTRVEPVYRAHAEGVELTIDRSEDWWRHRVFDGRGTEPYVYGWERDGELRAYAAYTVEDGAEPTLEVSEYAYVDSEARRHLLGFLGDHDSQVDGIQLQGPVDAPLYDLVDEPTELECTVEPGAMVRLVDVVAALSAVSQSDGSAGQVVLDVDDPLADWNDGTVTLDAAPDEVTCTVGGGDANATVDVATLSELYVGSRTVAEARELGRLSTDGETAAILRELFPPRDVRVREFF